MAILNVHICLWICRNNIFPDLQKSFLGEDPKSTYILGVDAGERLQLFGKLR